MSSRKIAVFESDEPGGGRAFAVDLLKSLLMSSWWHLHVDSWYDRLCFRHVV